MSVKRQDLVKYMEDNSYYLLREGKRHSIYTNNVKTIPIKRHIKFDRITANELCKQAGLKGFIY
ncbi:YcfA family protein [Candidatus Magnetoovum chiemensis]|nr:YcfA family protein [Candidatus Magnetoovum chiemensis]